MKRIEIHKINLRKSFLESQAEKMILIGKT